MTPMNTQWKKSMKHTRIILLIALLGLAAAGLPSLRAATITVTEVGDGLDVHTNLRQALTDAQDGDVIEFAPELGGYTLALIQGLGELVVNKSVTIRWVPTAGYNSYLGVSSWHLSRVFYISPGKTVTISGLNILNGSAPPPNYWGGAIYNDHASLTLNNCTISGNSAVQDFEGVGGAIFNDQGTLIVSGSTLSGNSSVYGGAICNNWLGAGDATVTITNSTISGNSASFGGGIMNEEGTLTLSNSTVSGNSAEYAAGGILNSGTTTSAATLAVTNSTLSGNSADQGGGILNDSTGTVTISNSTFSGNSTGGRYAGEGGGIWNTHTLTIINSTLSGNSAVNHGGGIYNTGAVGNAALTIGSTILNAGSSGGNIYNQDNPYRAATVTSLGYNLSSDNGGGYLTTTGDQINTDPRLGPLQDNGGPTFTHLPASDSPVIDAGDPARGVDQRGPGFLRVVNGRIDIGAAEVQATSTPTPSATPTPTATPRPHGRH